MSPGDPGHDVPRLLALLQDYGIRATFFVPGATAEQYPGVLAVILEAGDEVGHHGYLHELLVGADETTEREYLERGLDAFDRVAGVRPSGYRAPWWEATAHTRPLLAGYEFAYDSSFFDADAPYPAPECGGQLIEVPVYWALDDWERYAFWPSVTGDGRIDQPSAVVAAWWEEIPGHPGDRGHRGADHAPVLVGPSSQASCAARPYPTFPRYARFVGDFT